MECFRCGVSDKDEKLLEVIHRTGIVYVCIKCYPKVRLPIVQKKYVDFDEVLRERSVKERLCDISHVKNVESSSSRFVRKKSPEDVTLKEIVERNFNNNKIEKSEVPEDLVDNFNWAIMRRRRSLKMSQIQLCEKIGEPEVIVHALENGTLPRDYRGLIKKVESVLSIRLFKDKDLGPVDILSEARVPSGILVEEIKEKTKKPFSFNIFKKKEVSDDDLDLGELDLEKVNDIVGVPVEKEVSKKINYSEVRKNYGVGKNIENEKFKEKKKVFDDDELDSAIESGRNGEDLGSEDISKLVWRK